MTVILAHSRPRQEDLDLEADLNNIARASQTKPKQNKSQIKKKKKITQW